MAAEKIQLRLTTHAKNALVALLADLGYEGIVSVQQDTGFGDETNGRMRKNARPLSSGPELTPVTDRFWVGYPRPADRGYRVAMNKQPPIVRVIFGALLAPIAPCVLFSALVSATANQWSGFWFGVAAMLFVSEALGLLLGMPLYFVLRRVRAIGLLECVASGIVVAVIFNAASLMLPVDSGYSAGDSGGATIKNGHMTAHGYSTAVAATAIQSLLGCAIGLCFWVFAIKSTREPGHPGLR